MVSVGSLIVKMGASRSGEANPGEGGPDSLDPCEDRGAHKTPVRGSDSSSLPACCRLFSSKSILLSITFFFFYQLQKRLPDSFPCSVIFLMPWEPYIFCSLIIPYLDKLVKGIREKRI